MILSRRGRGDVTFDHALDKYRLDSGNINRPSGP